MAFPSSHFPRRARCNATSATPRCPDLLSACNGMQAFKRLLQLSAIFLPESAAESNAAESNTSVHFPGTNGAGNAVNLFDLAV
eukprot:1481237-Rhodomonas_salina.3